MFCFVFPFSSCWRICVLFFFLFKCLIMFKIDGFLSISLYRCHCSLNQCIYFKTNYNRQFVVLFCWSYAICVHACDTFRLFKWMRKRIAAKEHSQIIKQRNAHKFNVSRHRENKTKIKNKRLAHSEREKCTFSTIKNNQSVRTKIA